MYRIIRAHTETCVVDGTATDTPEEAIEFAKNNLNDDDFELIESSEYEYKAVPMNDLQ